MTNSIEVRLAHLEGAYEQVNGRLATIEGDIRELRAEIRDMRADFQRSLQTGLQSVRTEVLSRMDHQFFWLLGLMIISILSPIATRLFGR